MSLCWVYMSHCTHRLYSGMLVTPWHYFVTAKSSQTNGLALVAAHTDQSTHLWAGDPSRRSPSLWLALSTPDPPADNAVTSHPCYLPKRWSRSGRSSYRRCQPPTGDRSSPPWESLGWGTVEDPGTGHSVAGDLRIAADKTEKKNNFYCGSLKCIWLLLGFLFSKCCVR